MNNQDNLEVIQEAIRQLQAKERRLTQQPKKIYTAQQLPPVKFDSRGTPATGAAWIVWLLFMALVGMAAVRR